MTEIIERVEYVKVVKRSWTDDSFSKRTGNPKQVFKPNRLTNEVL